MQIIHLSFPWTLLASFAGWLVFMLVIPRFCMKIPNQRLNEQNILFRLRAWEKSGKTYKLLGVHRWKRLLPDGGAFIKGGYSKKMLSDYSRDNLEKYITESCRAELTHYLTILPFWVFGFIGPPQIIVYMLIYALTFNLPCIIAQRYNRPRVMAVIKQMKNKKV